MPSSSTRRGFLALCGASSVTGCSVPFLDDSVSRSVPTGDGLGGHVAVATPEDKSRRIYASLMGKYIAKAVGPPLKQAHAGSRGA